MKCLFWIKLRFVFPVVKNTWVVKHNTKLKLKSIEIITSTFANMPLYRLNTHQSILLCVFVQVYMMLHCAWNCFNTWTTFSLGIFIHTYTDTFMNICMLGSLVIFALFSYFFSFISHFILSTDVLIVKANIRNALTTMYVVMCCLKIKGSLWWDEIKFRISKLLWHFKNETSSDRQYISVHSVFKVIKYEFGCSDDLNYWRMYPLSFTGNSVNELTSFTEQ